MSRAQIAIDNLPKETLGSAYVWIAVLFFAAANSIVLLLFELGMEHPIDGRNAISFCNVLFVGNFCACITMLGLYRKQWSRENLRRLTRGDWASLIVLAIMTGAAIPSLVFLALENTTVTNVIFVQRVEPFLLLALPLLVFGRRPMMWAMVGAFLTLLGVGVAFYLESGGSLAAFGKGELFALAGALLTAVTTLWSKDRLERIPLGIFAVVRTGFGAVFFFVVAIYLFGPEHFQDAFQPILWQWMVVYGAIIVVGGQYFWFTGIKYAKTSDVSLISAFTPIAGVFFAYLLLDERPTQAIMAGGTVIVIGIIVGQFGPRLFNTRPEKTPELREPSISGAIEAETKVNFKGI